MAHRIHLCETFCAHCGQLRLWAKPDAPQVCGGCGSPKIETGPIGGTELTEKKTAWLKKARNTDKRWN